MADDADRTILPEATKMFLQRLMVTKVMRDDDATALLKRLYSEMKETSSTTSRTIADANKALAGMKLQINSVKIEGVSYHTLVNQVVDDVSKKYGCLFNDWEMEAFRSIIRVYGEEAEDMAGEGGQGANQQCIAVTGAKFFSSRPRKASKDDFIDFIDKLTDEHWLDVEGPLRGTEKSSYKLGVRAYAELPDLLRSHDIWMPQTIYHA